MNRITTAAAVLGSAAALAVAPALSAGAATPDYGTGANGYYHFSCQVSSSYKFGADVYVALSDLVHDHITEWHYVTVNPTWRAARASVAISPNNSDWTTVLSEGGTVATPSDVPQSFDNTGYNVGDPDTYMRTSVWNPSGSDHVTCSGVFHNS